MTDQDSSGADHAPPPANGAATGRPVAGAPVAGTPPAHDAGKSPQPDWNEALRDMYREVVDEPMPDTLADLIARLDRES